MVSWVLHGNEPNAIPVAKSSVYENFLTISNATPYNCGTYNCMAQNGVGKVHQEIVFLVNSPPRSCIQRKIWTQALSFSIDLECSFQAFPLPESYYWSKNGIQLSNNSQYEIQNFSSGHNLFHTKLRLKNIEKNHFGDYVCHVMNQLGTAESSVTLTEVKDPVCPPACSPATTLPPNASAASIKLSIFYCIMFLPLTHVWHNLNSN
ncbi:lachesin-like isoform X2 [Daphnia pulex]|nr:lachesin-like isoform X2 [Daphnia pulex]